MKRREPLRDNIRSVRRASMVLAVVVLSVFAFPKKKDGTKSSGDPVLVDAGAIATCDDLAGAYATARLIEQIPGATIFAVGDLAYPNGSDEDFKNCYGPTWGRFKDRTRPAPGNHEYHNTGASGY